MAVANTLFASHLFENSTRPRLQRLAVRATHIQGATDAPGVACTSLLVLIERFAGPPGTIDIVPAGLFGLDYVTRRLLYTT